MTLAKTKAPLFFSPAEASLPRKFNSNGKQWKPCLLRNALVRCASQRTATASNLVASRRSATTPSSRHQMVFLRSRCYRSAEARAQRQACAPDYTRQLIPSTVACACLLRCTTRGQEGRLPTRIAEQKLRSQAPSLISLLSCHVRGRDTMSPPHHQRLFFSSMY